MKSFSVTVAAALASTVSGLTISPNAKFNKRADGLPSDGIVANGVAFGFLPSDGSATSPSYTMASIVSTLGASKASTYGWYSQITSSSYDGGQLLEVLDDVVSSGAVFQPAVMPSIPFSEVTSGVASQVASVLKQFTDKGVEVWLRFGHEMNYYVTDGTYHGSADEFKTAWNNIHAAVASNSMIKMYWSPNAGSASDIANYWPGADTVDIVGIDCYPKSDPLTSADFDNCYSSFYQTYSAGYNLPFAIGETGYCGSSGPDAWLSQLVSQDMCNYSNYVAASWFEYDKECDFRIVMGSSSNLDQTKSLLLQNAGTGCSGDGGGGGTTPAPGFPADTCSWGCEGWNCSDSVPCQSSYSCNGGVCGSCTWGCNGWDCSASSPCNPDYTCVSGYCHHSGPATK